MIINTKIYVRFVCTIDVGYVIRSLLDTRFLSLLKCKSERKNENQVFSMNSSVSGLISFLDTDSRGNMPLKQAMCTIIYSTRETLIFLASTIQCREMQQLVSSTTLVRFPSSFSRKLILRRSFQVVNKNHVLVYCT